METGISATHKWNRTLAVSILPIMLGLVVILSIISGSVVIRLAKKQLRSESQLQSLLVDSWISDTKSKLSVYRNYLEARCKTDQDILDYIVVSHGVHDDFPVGVYVGTSKNVMLEPTSYQPEPDYVVASRPWYKKALTSNDFVISEPYTDVMLDKPCITVSSRLNYPWGSSQNSDVRVMAADLYLDYVNELAREMVSTGAISGGLFVSKDEGIIIANSTGYRIGEHLYPSDMDKHLEELRLYSEGDCITDTLDGVSYYVNVIAMKEVPWYLITYVGVDKVLKELYIAVAAVIVLALVSILFLFIMINHHARKMDLVQDRIVQLSDELQVQTTFVELIKLLTETHDFDAAINKCLRIIGDFYSGDRVYIFTVDYEKKVQNNTYEWCSENAIPQIQNLQYIPLSVNERWWPLFERNGFVTLTNLNRELKPGSSEYEILNEQQIESLIAYPFIHDGVITGYIGIDNPRINLKETFLIESAAACVSETLLKKQYTDILYDRSYKDILTGCKNRRAYFEDLSKLSAQAELSVGVVFADMNGLKDTNDTSGHEAGDKLIVDVMHFLDHCFDCYRHEVYRIGGDEFVVFVHDIEERAFHRIIGKTLEILEEKPVVSIGDSWIGNGSMVERLVADADALMYIRKKDYYRTKGHDRRAPEQLEI